MRTIGPGERVVRIADWKNADLARRTSVGVIVRTTDHAVASVMLVDPDAAVLAGLTSILNAQPALHVAATATDRASALAMVDASTEGVIVVARRFPDDDGFDICRELRDRAPQAQYVIHSAASIDEHEVLRSGGTAAVLKQLDNDDLIRTIHELISRHHQHEE